MIKFILILLVLLSGCEVTSEAPKSALDHHALLDLLVDIHYAEAALENLKMLEQDSLKVQYYTHILRYHGITKEEMEQIMENLRNNPTYLNQVYKEIYTKISSN